jgi:TPM domain
MAFPLRGKGLFCAVLVAVLAGPGVRAAQDSTPRGSPAVAPREPTGRMDVIVPAPPNHVLDEALIFSRDQENALGNLLVKASREDGADVYLATFTFIDGETIERRAERLKEAWSRGDFGLVLVHDRSTGNLTFSARTHEAMPITVSELEGLFQEANDAAQTPETPGEKLLALVQTLLPLLKGKVAVQRRLQHETISTQQWWVFGGVAAALILIFFSFVLARGFKRTADAARPVPAFFPTVAVEPRFGGGYGGGSMAEVKFANASPEPQRLVSA